MRQPLWSLMKEGRQAILLAILIGLSGYTLTLMIKVPYADPLLLAMLLGILVRTALGEKWRLDHSATLATVLFIPVGIAFYAMKNLNFAKLRTVEISIIILLIAVILVYYLVIVLIGKAVGQKKQITYL